MKLYTIGYEGQDIETFCEFLSRKKIKKLIDVRKNPVSRKKGFSKNKLAQALSAYGITYQHFSELGVPSAWRKQAKKNLISRQKMFRRYELSILPKASAAIAEIYDSVSQVKTAIMCFEADHSDCHRYFVSEKLELDHSNLEIVHLHI